MSLSRTLSPLPPLPVGLSPPLPGRQASVWLWLGPLLALAYILSPLDIIPDFIPLVGWMDDLLAAGYILSVLYQRAAAGAPPAAPVPRGWGGRRR